MSQAKLPSLEEYLRGAKAWCDKFSKIGPITLSWTEYEKLCREQWVILKNLTPEQREVYKRESEVDNRPMLMAVKEQIEKVLHYAKGGRLNELKSQMRRYKKKIEDQVKSVVEGYGEEYQGEAREKKPRRSEVKVADIILKLYNAGKIDQIKAIIKTWLGQNQDVEDLVRWARSVTTKEKK